MNLLTRGSIGAVNVASAASMAVMLLGLVSLFSACVGESTATPDPTPVATKVSTPTPTPVPPTPTPEPRDADLGVILRITPEEVHSLYVVDMLQLREDPDLADLYDAVLEEDVEAFDRMGIDLAVATAFVIAEGDDFDEVFFIRGEADQQDLIIFLKDLEYEDRTYRDVAMWEDGNGSFDYLAFPQRDQILLSDDREAVRTFVRTQAGESGPLKDDDDLAEVVDRLPSGIYSFLYSNCDTPDGTSQWNFQGCEALGVSADKLDANTLSITVLFKFRSESRASVELDDVEEAINDQEDEYIWFGTEVNQSGEFIEVTAKVDLQDLIKEGDLFD